MPCFRLPASFLSFSALRCRAIAAFWPLPVQAAKQEMLAGDGGSQSNRRLTVAGGGDFLLHFSAGGAGAAVQAPVGGRRRPAAGTALGAWRGGRAAAGALTAAHGCCEVGEAPKKRVETARRLAAGSAAAGCRCCRLLQGSCRTGSAQRGAFACCSALASAAGRCKAWPRIRLSAARGADPQRSDAAARGGALPGCSNRPAWQRPAAGRGLGCPTRSLGTRRHLATAAGRPGATMGRGGAGAGRRRRARPLLRPGRQHQQQQR